MAVTTPPSITVAESITAIVGATSTNIVIPSTGTPTIMRLLNLGPFPVFVLQTNGPTPAVTDQNGVALWPGQELFMAIVDSDLNAITWGSGGVVGNTSRNSTLNVTVGT